MFKRRIYIQNKNQKRVLTLEDLSFDHLLMKVSKSLKKEKENIQTITLNQADILDDDDVMAIKDEDTLVIVLND